MLLHSKNIGHLLLVFQLIKGHQVVVQGVKWQLTALGTNILMFEQHKAVREFDPFAFNGGFSYAVSNNHAIGYRFYGCILSFEDMQSSVPVKKTAHRVMAHR